MYSIAILNNCHPQLTMMQKCWEFEVSTSQVVGHFLEHLPPPPRSFPLPVPPPSSTFACGAQHRWRGDLTLDPIPPHGPSPRVYSPNKGEVKRSQRGHVTCARQIYFHDIPRGQQVVETFNNFPSLHVVLLVQNARKCSTNDWHLARV